MRKTRCILITEKDLTDLELEFNKLVEFYEEIGWEVRDVHYIKTPDSHNYNVIISKESKGKPENKMTFVKPEMVELNTGRSKKSFVKPELVMGKIVEDPFICRERNHTPNNKGSKEDQIIGSIAGIEELLAEELLAERMIKSSKYDSQLFLNHLLRDILGGV